MCTSFVSARPQQPEINVRPNNEFSSILVTINNHSPCVLHYSITVSESQGEVFKGVIRNDRLNNFAEIDVVTVFDNLELDICRFTYTTTVESNYYNILQLSAPARVTITYTGRRVPIHEHGIADELLGEHFLVCGVIISTKNIGLARIQLFPFYLGKLKYKSVALLKVYYICAHLEML